MISVKLYAIIAAAFVIVGGAFGLGWHLGALGPKAALATERLAQERNRAAIQATAAKAIADATRDKETAIAANEVISNDYEAKLSAARASAGSLAQRLRDAQARAATNQRAMPPAANNPGALAGAAAPGVGRLNDATGAALAECAEVRAGYSALIAQLRPQL